MVLVYFRGYGDWFVDEDQGHPIHLIKAEDRGTYTKSQHHIGYQFYRPCDLLEGVFALTVSDEKLFQMTGNLADIKIDRLLPVRHHDGAFTQMVDKGLLSDEAFERCYFEIATNRYRRSQLKRKPELIESGKLHYDLVLYKSITDETNSILTRISESESDSTPNRVRNPMKRYNDGLALLHDAIDELEKATGKTPDDEQIATFILGDAFHHKPVKDRDPQDKAIKRRKLRLIDDSILDYESIKRRCKSTIFKNND
jgi:hypothetical protein